MTTKTKEQKELAPAEQPTRSLLEQVLDQGVSERTRQLDAALIARIEKIEEVLPDAVKGQGARLARRALLVFSESERLQECTPQSFVKCVLQAAELGLAVDGKLCHAVPYNCKVKKEKGPDEWEIRAQCIPDWKGLVAIALRNGVIVPPFRCDIVCENDTFDHGRDNGKPILRHTSPLANRGEPIAAFCELHFPDGSWDYELMLKEEIEKIQARSKPGKTGPWQTDRGQMWRKTVGKRALKPYAFDSDLSAAMDLSNQEFPRLDEQPKGLRQSSLSAN